MFDDDFSGPFAVSTDGVSEGDQGSSVETAGESVFT